MLLVICCPADLITYSATTRYIIREYGTEVIFSRRPATGSVIHLDPSVTNKPDHHVFLMFTRATNRDPLYNETLHICLGNLLERLVETNVRDIHFPIIDPERPDNNLFNWYNCLTDYFADERIDVYLHDRVYVSIAAISQFPTILPVDEFDHQQQNSRREIPNLRYKETLFSIKASRPLACQLSK